MCPQYANFIVTVITFSEKNVRGHYFRIYLCTEGKNFLVVMIFNAKFYLLVPPLFSGDTGAAEVLNTEVFWIVMKCQLLKSYQSVKES
jgi:hypothetical protein